MLGNEVRRIHLCIHLYVFICHKHKHVIIIKEELMYLRGRLGDMKRVRYGRRKEGNDANTILLYENLKKLKQR